MENYKIFTNNELDMIKYALDYLHDTDLSNLDKNKIEAIESAMKKLNMDFVSQM